MDTISKDNEEPLHELVRYDGLESEPADELGQLVKLASQICGTPIAAISLVESHRQWFKATLGTTKTKPPREKAFIAHTVQQEALVEVEDATQDEQFSTSPLVTGSPSIRFYAGMPLRIQEGVTLGVLCVVDLQPRTLTADQRFALKVLADQVIKQLELQQQVGIMQETMELVAEKNTVIADQHVALSEAMRTLSHGLDYAAHIQQTMLPSAATLRHLFEGHFVLFKPLNVVSGDFFWLREVDHMVVMAVGDSTGHGLPGAMLGIVGIGLLNQIVSEDRVLHPRRILEALHNGVRDMFKVSPSGHRDGMDISVIAWNQDSGRLEFASAKQRMFLAYDDDVKEIRGDKMSIAGLNSDETRVFTNRSFTLYPGAKVYLLSDGYVNQFGGKNKTKFGVKQLKALLCEYNHLPMPQQLTQYSKALDEWIGTGNQIDDITLVGLEF